jgi:hypothetical protein
MISRGTHIFEKERVPRDPLRGLQEKRAERHAVRPRVGDALAVNDLKLEILLLLPLQNLTRLQLARAVPDVQRHVWQL